jgi:hypothetical protein
MLEHFAATARYSLLKNNPALDPEGLAKIRNDLLAFDHHLCAGR